MKVVFLYTELAEYVVNCFERLAKSGTEVHVMAYPVNPEAPFELGNREGGHYYQRVDFTSDDIVSLVHSIQPDAIFVSGWVDEGYLDALSKLRATYRRVLVSDNATDNGLKSRASLLRARAKFKKLFDFAFVSGQPQRLYAEGMGFKKNEVFTGFYTADEQRYLKIENENLGSKFPKRFVFVGRYLPFKGIYDLWNSFMEIDRRGWELHCYGTGADWEKRIEAPGIFHHGFIQPENMESVMAKGGIFVLPSHKEPWGVVVHEFAAAGFPLLVSNKVNAASAFLSEGLNGRIFKAKSKSELKQRLLEFMSLDDKELTKMSSESRNLAEEMSLSRWLKTVEVIANRKV